MIIEFLRKLFFLPKCLHCEDNKKVSDYYSNRLNKEMAENESNKRLFFDKWIKCRDRLIEYGIYEGVEE